MPVVATRWATDSSRLLAVSCSSPSRVESRTLLRTGSVLLVGTTRPTTLRPSARFSCKHSSFIVGCPFSLVLGTGWYPVGAARGASFPAKRDGAKASPRFCSLGATLSLERAPLEMAIDDQWQREMQRYLAHFNRAGKRPTIVFSQHAQPSPVWTPAMDVYETVDALVILLDLAGVDAEHTEVHAEPHLLVMRGVRRERHAPEHPDEQRSYLALEIPYGRFERSVRLPAGPGHGGGARELSRRAAGDHAAQAGGAPGADQQRGRGAHGLMSERPRR